jgi:hypothetical protein
MSYQNIEVKITHVQTVLDEVLGLLRTKKNVNSASVSAASSESAPSSPVASETTAENVGSLTNASSGSESGSPVANAPNAATPAAEAPAAEVPAAEAPAAEVPAAAPVVAEPVPERTCLSGKVDHDLSEQVFSCIKSDIETLDKKLKIKFSDMYNRDTKKALAAYADDNQGKYFKLIKPSLKKQFSAVTNIPLYEIHPKDAYKPEVVARKRSEMRKMPATTIWDLDPKPEGSYLEIKIMYNSISNQEFFSKVRNVSNKVGGDYSPQVQFIFALQISDTPFAKNVSASRNNAANAVAAAAAVAAANTGVSKNGAANAAAVAAAAVAAANAAANTGVSKNGAVNGAAAVAAPKNGAVNGAAAVAAPKNGAVNAAANSGVSKNGAVNAPAPAPAAPLNEAALRRQAVVNQQNRWIRLAENRGTEENIRARNEALKRNQAANLTRKKSANAQKGFVKSRVNQINATLKNQEARNALNAARRASASKSQPIPFLRESSASGANRVANSMRRNAARIRTARALPQATGWWGKKGGARRRSRKHRR